MTKVIPNINPLKTHEGFGIEEHGGNHPPMFQICINPGMIAVAHEAGLGSADHHILHYLSRTQSHLIPKGQSEYAVQ